MLVATMQRAPNRLGERSLTFPSRPGIWSTFTVVGPMEGKGPLGDGFDTIMPDDRYGEDSWERAESKMLEESITHCIQKSSLQQSDIDCIFAGDLLDQTTSSSYAVSGFAVPFMGIFSACATFGEGLILAAMMAEGGFADRSIVAVSSHHHAAERQFRFPTELGVQKPKTAQWTATIAAATLVGRKGVDKQPQGPFIVMTGATVGEVFDIGAKDPFNLGSAMAPAAADTLTYHFNDFKIAPDTYDLIITGDLGYVGNGIVADLLEAKGLAVRSRLEDCGLLLYDREKQGAMSGASGTACSAGVFCAYIEKGMLEGRWRNVLFAPTGALFSATSSKQNRSIPTICHAVAFGMNEG